MSADPLLRRLFRTGGQPPRVQVGGSSRCQLPAARKITKRGQSWDVDEARTFLESAYADRDPLYPLWVLILVLGLRKGEAQGLVWPSVDLGNAA